MKMTYIIAVVVIILLGLFLYPKKIGRFDLNDYAEGKVVRSRDASCLGRTYYKIEGGMIQTKYCIGIPYNKKCTTRVVGEQNSEKEVECE